MKNSSLPRKFSLLLFAASATFACSSDSPSRSSRQANHSDQDVTLEEVLQNNLKAVREESSFGSIESTDLTLRISEADYSLVGRYRASSDGLMRIDVFDGDTRVYSEGKDEMGVWEWPGGEETPENVSHDGVGALEHGIEFNLFALAELPARGHQIELAGTDTLRDERYFVLKITLSDGFATYRYVNADTWLIDLSRDFRAFHPGVDDTKKNIETRYEQWKRTDGVLAARRSQSVDLTTGSVIATTLVLESRYNVPREELDLARTHVPSGAPKLNEQDDR